eukprot:264170_1
MSSQQLIPWLRCRHLLNEFGDDTNAILDPFQHDILQIVGGIGAILKEFLNQKPQHISGEILNNLWNLLSSTKQQTSCIDSVSFVYLPDDILSSICTYLNLNDLNNLNQVCYITSIAIRLPLSAKPAVSQLNLIRNLSLKDCTKQIILSPYPSQQYDAMQSFQSIITADNKQDNALNTAILAAVDVGTASHLTQCLIRTCVYDAHFRFETAELLCDLLERNSSVLTVVIWQRIHQMITIKPVYDEDIIGIIMKQLAGLIASNYALVIDCNALPFIFQWMDCLLHKQFNKYEQFMMNIIKTLIVSARQNVMQYMLRDTQSSVDSLCALLNTINGRICTQFNIIVTYDTVYYKRIRHHVLHFMLFSLNRAKDQIVVHVLNAHGVQYVLAVIHELNRTNRGIHDMLILGVCVQIISAILLYSEHCVPIILDDEKDDVWGTLISVDNEDHFECTKDSIMIGNAERNDMRLDDLDETHCQIQLETDSMYLIDVSTGGIYVDDVLVGNGNRVALHNGSKIVLRAGCLWTKQHQIAYILQLKDTTKEVQVVQQLMSWSYVKQIRQYMHRDSIGFYVLLSFALLLQNSVFIAKVLKNDSNDGNAHGLLDEIIDIIMDSNVEHRKANNIKNGAQCVFNIVQNGTDEELKLLNENHGVMAALFGLMDLSIQRDQQLMVESLHCIDILLEKQVMKNGSNYSQRVYKRKIENLQYHLIEDNQDHQFSAGDDLKLSIQRLSQKYDTDA